MTHRRRQDLAIAATAVLFGSFLASCTDAPLLSPEDAKPRGYITEPTGKRLCPSNDPYGYNDPYRYDDPYPYGYHEPVYEECVFWEPPVLEPAPDRPVYYSTDAAATALEPRLDASTETLVYYEQQQGYTSLRAYLDPGEWTESGAAAGAGSYNATGSEATALANDGVTRSDFPVSDAILSLLNTRGEIQMGDTVYKLTRDNAYAVHVNDLWVLREKVPTLSSPAPADGDPRIVVQAVETTDTPVLEEEPLYSRSVAATGAPSYAIGFATSNCTWRSGDYRMHGKSYITNALFYSEAGVKTEWERKKWFWWSNAWQAGTLEYAYTTASLRKGNNYIFPTSGSGFKSATSGVSKVITSGWFVSIRGTINGTHTSSIGQCYTRVSK